MPALTDKRRLRAGIVGGGRGAFIGAVHRMAAELDGQALIVAGALSSDPATAAESGPTPRKVKNSTLKHVDLNVEYVEENILRDHEVNFVTPAEEKAEKEAAEKAEEEKEAKAKKEAAEKLAAEEAAEERATHAAEEKAAAELRAEEVAEAKITAEEAAAKEAEEKAANEAKEKAANEQREKEVEAAVKKASATTAAVTTTTTTTGGAAPLYTPIGGVLGVSASAKPLTPAQKLARALKACKKLPKSKRAACEAKAKHAYAARRRKK